MDRQQVTTVRSFNRAVTRRLGVLSDRFLGRGRPLSEARLLYEIGGHGADVRDLRARLSLDSGYLSRLLRSLERQGLITSGRAKHDARVTTASLTAKGATEVKELNRLSNAFATSLLQSLGEPQRVRLVAAMSDVERLMQAAAVEIAVVSPRSAAARWCLNEYFRELAKRFANGFEPAKSIPATPEELTPPAGYLLVARLDGQAVGCGALKVKDKQIGEIKRMWVAPRTRGLGIGHRILTALEERARLVGLRVLRLETNETLKEAQHLYRRSGYREVPPFNTEPYAHHWFEKTGLQPAIRRREGSSLDA
jgi:DNA-binding MarR family transcriptional regulator/predicted N-acetyltransferase YhbS